MCGNRHAHTTTVAFAMCQGLNIYGKWQQDFVSLGTHVYIEHTQQYNIVKTSLSGFDVTATAVVGHEYD